LLETVPNVPRSAETEDLLANAGRKLAAKGCDWILANDVSAERGTFGSVSNKIYLLRSGVEPEAWPEMDKAEVAARLAARIAAELGGAPVTPAAQEGAGFGSGPVRGDDRHAKTIEEARPGPGSGH
jgi:hypothetical protein